MATQIKHYISKVNLPHGIKKGDIFIENITDGNIMCYSCDMNFKSEEKTLNLLPYIPSNEPNFFTEIEKPIEPKFKVGDFVRVKNDLRISVSSYKTKQITTKTKLKITGFSKKSVNVLRKEKMVVFYDVIPDNTTYKFSIEEDKLVNLELYYFFNSKGILCSEICGRELNADKFRLSIGNYFKTKEESIFYINKLKNLNK